MFEVILLSVLLWKTASIWVLRYACNKKLGLESWKTRVWKVRKANKFTPMNGRVICPRKWSWFDQRIEQYHSVQCAMIASRKDVHSATSIIFRPRCASATNVSTPSEIGKYRVGVILQDSLADLACCVEGCIVEVDCCTDERGSQIGPSVNLPPYTLLCSCQWCFV